MEMDTINLVEELKRKYQSANPFYICEKMGIKIQYVPFIENPKGQFQEIRDRAIIFLNDELRDSEERFYICAHELGHAIFHRGLSSYYVSTRTSRSKSESEANCFAANLIVSLYKEDNDQYPRKIEELKKQLDPVNVLLFGRMALLDRRLNRKLKYCLAIILKEEMTIVFAEEYDGTIKTAYNTLSKIYKMTGSK